jgi:hypothetical protein
MSKVALLFADPKRMSNRAVEVCVTLFALYIIVELNNTPAGKRGVQTVGETFWLSWRTNLHRPHFLPHNFATHFIAPDCDRLGPCLHQFIA